MSSHCGPHTACTTGRSFGKLCANMRANWCLTAAAVLVLCAGCGDEEENPCITDRDCQVGSRCVSLQGTFGGGSCEVCPDPETPYDGQDNDCDPSTRDVDLDGDGDNAIDSAHRPGTDCNDNDPEIHPGLPETCDDGKDNDCDGDTDEADCADLEPPTVRFLAPSSGASVFGNLEVRVEAEDDLGLEAVTLNADTLELTGTASAGSSVYAFSLDTTTLREGDLTLSVSALDLAGRTTTATRGITIDNRSPPVLLVRSPVANASYAGFMEVEVEVQDASAIAAVELSLDGGPKQPLDGPPYLFTVDTSTLTEGPHTLTLEAEDALGNRGATDVRFTVDRTPPEVAITAPMPGETLTGTVDVEVTAVDALSRIADITVDGQSAGGSSPVSFPLDTTALPNGPYTLIVSATDNTRINGGSGNVATDSIEVMIDNLTDRPRVTLSPISGSAVFGETTLVAEVASPTAVPIARVDFRIDGSLVASTTLEVRVGEWEAVHDFSNEDTTRPLSVSATAFDTLGAAGSATVTLSAVGPPTFRLSQHKAVQSSLAANSNLQLGDIDGDGVTDVAIAGTPCTLVFGRIDADGHWTAGPEAPLNQGLNATDLRLLDIEQDGDVDLVTVNGNELTIFQRFDNGYFVGQALQLPGAGTSLELGDFNGDGEMDVAVGLSTSPGFDIAVYFKDADGVFTHDNSYGQQGNVTEVRVQDVDGLNGVDIVLGRQGSGNTLITTYPNKGPLHPDGPGQFFAGQDSFPDLPPDHPGSPPEAIVIGDIFNDGDGVPDVVVAMNSGPAAGQEGLAILRGNPNFPGTFFAYPSGFSFTQLAPSDVQLSDLNGDGLLDIVVAVSRANGIEVWTNQGNGAFSRTGTYVVAENLARFALEDLDGDGLDDLIGVSPVSQSIVHCRNLGNGEFLAAPTIVPNNIAATYAVTAGDLLFDSTPDGLVDFVVAHTSDLYGPPRLGFYRNIGARQFVFEQEIPVLPTIVDGLTTGHIDDDGRLDLGIGGNANTEVVSFFFNEGRDGGLQSFTEVQTLLPRPVDLEIADLDGNGTGELIYSLDRSDTPPPTDGSTVLTVDRTGILDEVVIDRGQGANDIAVGDFNNDQLMDYAVANAITDNVTVNLNNGSGFDTVVYNALPGITALSVGRVGNDMVNDIVGIGAGGVIVMEGDPVFGFNTASSYPAGSSPSELLPGDFNHDGLLDVVVLNPDDKASLLMAHPDGGFFPPRSIPVGDGPVDFVAGDFDNDGRDDLAVVHIGAPAIMIIYSDGDQF